MSKIIIHDIQELDLRTVFPREDTSFTPWLAEPQNLGRLSQVLGFELDLLQVEVSTGTFRTDILATRRDDDSRVVIENQFGRSDHDHLGKTLTYLAAHDARTIVWIAERFADEHRAALSWLNDNTPEEVTFWAVVPRLIRIADSAPGLRFEVEVRPNSFVKRARETDRKIDSSIMDLRRRYWDALMHRIATDAVLSQAETRYGGAAGHLWLLPPKPVYSGPGNPHVLLYLSAPASAEQQHAGFGISPGSDADDELQSYCQRAFEELLTDLPQSFVESLRMSPPCWASFAVALNNDDGMADAIETLLPIARSGFQRILRGFD